MRKIVLTLLALAAPLPAAAHVVAAPDTARAGSYAAVAFRVGHACSAGDVTLKVRIEIPPGVVSARPQPKPGWTYEIEREAGADPKAAPSAVTFTGRLPDEAFDDFPLLMKLPTAADTLVFPVIQTCEKGESQWAEVPSTGAPGEKLSRPAATLRLIPADAASAGHKH
ncbi:MAG: nuclear export factor GLE1 [Caulobacter sp. 12-67-6]|nr:MAG: nuclear export factor GLE1 [Caulobacter sp. 12-67-6]OYX72276.1 MAG: nuclear export factor GLE1 [Caulobacter sp. 32-67-35]OYX96125.1 MAG: nuclear export factor GLE1 [Caulobacter sp. 35-67-4]OZA79498.1 MAG: nuclear export factor GLE1 [Caulobacter sp. 39-67-4]HQR90156.1 YcnI family protein [Caulobacter sp.]